MTTFLTALFFLVLAIGGVIVRKTYYHLPLHELKRQAEKHDPLASVLYKAVAYDGSLRVFMGMFIAVTAATGFVLLARVAPLWLSLLSVIVLLWAAFSWLPASRITKVGARLTILVTPLIAWLLAHLYPLLSRTARVAQKRYNSVSHTGIFERQDLLDLIEEQQHQTGNRVSSEELEIARRALSFDDHQVADILTSCKHIKTIYADDTLGPILIDELHKNGNPRVLVRESKKGPFVGSLELTHVDLLQKTGLVRDIMDTKVYYLHENDQLSSALHAFFVTNHDMFIVVNSAEEYVGIITVEALLKQLLGHIPGDDFDQYANLKAVAARHRTPETKIEDETPVKTDEEVIE